MGRSGCGAGAAVEDIFRRRSVFGESGERDDRNLCAVCLHATLPELQEVVCALRPNTRCFHVKGQETWRDCCQRAVQPTVLCELEVDCFESSRADSINPWMKPRDVFVQNLCACDVFKPRDLSHKL